MRLVDWIAPRFWHLALVLFAQACAVSQPARVAPATATATTIVVVRHAEKSTDDPRDPSLSPEGHERAKALIAVLKDAGVADIYTTQYKRTRQTAEPLAQQLGISIAERPINAVNAATYARDLAQEILTRSAGKGVLVVGHSNTVPEIVKALSGSTVPSITDAEYDHVFVVVVPASGSARLMRTRFGDPGSLALGQPTDLAGTWKGYWTRAGDTLPITMLVQRDTTGRLTATFESERLRVSGIPFAELRTEGCCDVTLQLRGDRTTSEFKGQLRGDALTGFFREGASEGRFAYSRAKAAAPPFEEREITFGSGDITLAGTLLLPRVQHRVPAVVFLHGSGAEGRWASRYLASQVAARGIAVLIFDKRGVGGSSGDWRLAGPDDLGADAVAAVARLLEEPRIDPKRIGIHGHSQGGTLAPMVAVRSRHVAFVIGSAAAGLPTDSMEIFSILNSVLPAATTADDSASATQYVLELVSVAYHARPRARLDSLAERLKGRPWFFPPPVTGHQYWRFSRVFATYNPVDWWARVRVPVLLVYGVEDQRVPAAASASRIGAALRAAGNTKLTVQMHPGADHTFRLRAGPSGWPVSAPDYIPNLLRWLGDETLRPSPSVSGIRRNGPGTRAHFSRSLRS